MALMTHLKVVRARWILVAAAVVVALAAGLATTSRLPEPETQTTKTYTATALVLSTQTEVGSLSLETLAAIVLTDPVAEAVAEEIGFDGDATTLADKMSAEVDRTKAAILGVTATSPDPQEAELLADTFAQELVTYLDQRETQTRNAELRSLRRQIDQLNEEIAELDKQIGDDESPDEGLVAERDSKKFAYNGLEQQYQNLVSEQGQPLGVEVVEEAVASPVEESTLAAAGSRKLLLAVAAIIGLLVGGGIAVLVERMRNPIRTKHEAEEHLGMPVLAEIPGLGPKGRKGITVVEEPKAPGSEAFRLLEAGMSSGTAWAATEEGSRSNGKARPKPPRVIAVTSPGVGEGKTTMVANLAAAYAERGKKVVVLSCDFRRPRIHRLFGVSNEDGMAKALRDGQDVFDDGRYVWRGPLNGIWVIPSGPFSEAPFESLGSEGMRGLIASALQHADIVLIDTPPLLAVADTARILPDVDAVLVVARAGKTSVDSAKRTAELMRLLTVHAGGVVLNGSSVSTTYRHYRSKGEPRTRSDSEPTQEDEVGLSPTRVSP